MSPFEMHFLKLHSLLGKLGEDQAKNTRSEVEGSQKPGVDQMSQVSENSTPVNEIPTIPETNIPKSWDIWANNIQNNNFENREISKINSFIVLDDSLNDFESKKLSQTSKDPGLELGQKDNFWASLPSFRHWNGEVLADSRIPLDTETEVIEAHQIPRLALASSCDGDTGLIIHPNRVLEFMRVHKHKKFVFQNLAFDFWVLHKHFLAHDNSVEGVGLLWQLLDQNSFHDTMVLDQLLRIAEGEKNCQRRALDVLCSQYLGQPLVDKSDPYRMKYGEIIGKSFDDVDPGFFEYASRDAVATIRLYCAILERIKEFFSSRNIKPDLACITRYGVLTEQIQNKASVTLTQIGRNGIKVDEDRLKAIRSSLEAEVNFLFEDLATQHPSLYPKKKSGEYKRTPSGSVSRSNKALDQILLAEIVKIEQMTGKSVAIPRNGKRISYMRELWEGFAKHSDFVKKWLSLDEMKKLIGFTSFNTDDEGRVHANFNPLVATGRTSCSSPNLQNLPRVGGFRECFVPSEGNAFVIVDYAYIELITLAATCEKRLGFSQMGEVVRNGVDPHVSTAALFSGLTEDEFLNLKETDSAHFKEERQKAKAVNFGIPGGMGINSLVAHSKRQYGVDLSPDEMKELKQKFLAKYQELSIYLKDDRIQNLCSNLRCRTEDLINDPNFHGMDSVALGSCIEKVVKGNPKTSEGRPYKESFVDRIWELLETHNRNTQFVNEIALRIPSEALARKLFCRLNSTITGRYRGGVSYTESKNLPFQGLAADGAKVALYELVRNGYKVVGFVHDEFIVEIPKGPSLETEKERIAQIIEEAMSSVLGSTIPVRTEAHIADAWTK